VCRHHGGCGWGWTVSPRDGALVGLSAELEGVGVRECRDSVNCAVVRARTSDDPEPPPWRRNSCGHSGMRDCTFG